MTLAPTPENNPHEIEVQRNEAQRDEAQARRVFEEPLPPLLSRVATGDDWIDLYEILDVSPNASDYFIEEAIRERGADALFFAFARGYKPLLVKLIETHQQEFRAILLDPETRRRYDEQRALHRAQDQNAVSYEAFLETVKFPVRSGCMSTAILAFCFWGAIQLLI